MVRSTLWNQRRSQIFEISKFRFSKFSEIEIFQNFVFFTALLIDNTYLPWTVPVHCRSTTWNQLLGGVQPQSDRLTILVAVHKEFEVVPNTIVIEANNTKARKCSTVTETSLDVVWVPTGVGSVRTVLLRFLTIPYLKPKQLFVPDLLVNL